MNGTKIDISLDDMLNTETAAKWLGLRPAVLMAKSKGRNAIIPGFWINQRVVRFHPRTIIAKLAFDAGVNPEVIALSLTIKAPPQSHD